MNFLKWVTEIEKITMVTYSILDRVRREKIKTNYAEYMFNTYGVQVSEKR